MKNYFKYEIILVKYPFTDLSDTKVRPAVIISEDNTLLDVFIVPLTSKTNKLLSDEFVLEYWKESGLNIPTAVKRGIYTISKKIIIKSIGKLKKKDANNLLISVKKWLGLVKK